MRIRAEYIMYGGFCIAFLIQLVFFWGLKAIHLLHNGFNSSQWLHYLGIFFEGVAVLGGAVLMVFRNQQTIGTFDRAVAQFYDAASTAGKLGSPMHSPSVV